MKMKKNKTKNKNVKKLKKFEEGVEEEVKNSSKKVKLLKNL